MNQKKFTPDQHKAAKALANGVNITAAAAQTGLSRQGISLMWNRVPGFKELVAKYGENVGKEAPTSAELKLLATDALRDLLLYSEDKVRATVAFGIIDRARDDGDPQALSPLVQRQVSTKPGELDRLREFLQKKQAQALPKPSNENVSDNLSAPDLNRGSDNAGPAARIPGALPEVELGAQAWGSDRPLLSLPAAPER